MNPVRMPVTRRTVLRLAAGAAVGTGLVSAGEIAGIAGAATPPPGVTAAADDSTPVDPQGGAGVFDVDPDQAGVSQDPNVVVQSDIAALPEDMDL